MPHRDVESFRTSGCSAPLSVEACSLVIVYWSTASGGMATHSPGRDSTHGDHRLQRVESNVVPSQSLWSLNPGNVTTPASRTVIDV
jgi:hypothetical protein